MFKAKFPVDLTVQGTIDSEGKLVLQDAAKWFRYERLPGHPTDDPKFVTDSSCEPPLAANATLGPWQIADVSIAEAPSVGTRVFKLSFNGGDVDTSDPSDPYAGAFLDEETVQLELYMGLLEQPGRPSLHVIASIYLSLKVEIRNVEPC